MQTGTVLDALQASKNRPFYSAGAATAACKAILKKDPQNKHQKNRPKSRADSSSRSEPIARRGGKVYKACVGKRSQRFTSGITRRFGVAPAQASRRASECWVSGCGRSRPTRERPYFIICRCWCCDSGIGVLTILGYRELLGTRQVFFKKSLT